MKDWTTRFALAALLGFFTFFFALPVSCCGFMLYSEHLNGDAQSGGPQAVSGAMGLSAVLAVLVGVAVWRRTRPKVAVDRHGE